MKLTKMQITALASKVANEVRVELKKLRDIKVEQSLKEIQKCPKIKAYRKFLDVLYPDGYNDKTLDYHVRRLLEDLKKAHTPDTLHVSSSDFETDIIVGTIECDGVDELLQSIKANYLNKINY